MQEDLEPWLQKKIILSNTSAFIFCLGIATPIMVVSLFLFPPLALSPAIGVGICILTIVLNYYKEYQLARLVITILPNTLVFLYHTMAVPEGGQPHANLLVLHIAFALLPFIIFDQREWIYILTLSLLFLFSIIMMPQATGWIESNADDSPMRTGWFHYLILVTSALTGFFIMQVHAQISFKSEKESMKLLAEDKKKQAALKQSEDALKASISQVEANQKEAQKRNWASENLAKIALTLRNAATLEDMATEVLQEIITALEINQGSLFLIEEDNNQQQLLHMKATYAFGRRKYLNRTIQMGEGLLGQAWKEKDTIQLEQIPQNYINITSGLGDAPPNNLLIMPLVANETVQGLLELASYEPLQAYQLEFLQQLGENMAAAIYTAGINDKTKKLLADAREAEEQMQQQQEEMRQNMEELSATQEEISRKEKEYINKIAMLEKAIQQKLSAT